MKLLAIESSCDETAAAVVEMGEQRAILSNIVASQVDVHRLYGGVVPEIASRAHIEAVSRITYEALDEAGLSLSGIDAVCVTANPGLIGALLVGVNFAKSLAYAHHLPLVPVHHVRAHVAAAYLAYPELEPPFLALVASGGHTAFYAVHDYTDFRELGGTRDDAAGESFDKVGRVMGLPYPGGAALDRLAGEGDPTAVHFPSPAIAGADYDLSFSGLKTAALNYLNRCAQTGEAWNRADVAASYTEAVVSGIAKKFTAALRDSGMRRVVLAGGVAANSHLRRRIASVAEEMGADFYVPPISLCGDNGAMVGAQGYYEFLAGVRGGPALNARATD